MVPSTTCPCRTFCSVLLCAALCCSVLLCAALLTCLHTFIHTHIHRCVSFSVPLKLVVLTVERLPPLSASFLPPFRYYDQGDDAAFSGSHVFIRDGGYSALAQHMKGLIGDDCFRLGRVATNIQWAVEQPAVKEEEGVAGSASSASSASGLSPPEAVPAPAPGVRVVCRRLGDGSEETFDADAVLVTLPLGVLKAVVEEGRGEGKGEGRGSDGSDGADGLDGADGMDGSSSAASTGHATRGRVQDNAGVPVFDHNTGVPVFDPPLPASKVDAIRSLGFGVTNKIVLSFKDRWWMSNTIGNGNAPRPPSVPLPRVPAVAVQQARRHFTRGSVASKATASSPSSPSSPAVQWTCTLAADDGRTLPLVTFDMISQFLPETATEANIGVGYKFTGTHGDYTVVEHHRESVDEVPPPPLAPPPLAPLPLAPLVPLVPLVPPSPHPPPSVQVTGVARHNGTHIGSVGSALGIFMVRGCSYCSSCACIHRVVLRAGVLVRYINLRVYLVY